jgi:Na+-translocating ferredoxin:NAD+ oxidoreductase subunit A
MENYLSIVVGAALVDNILLITSFGLGPMFGGARRLESALCIGLTTAFCLTALTGVSYLINEYILVRYEVEFLRVLIYLTLIVICWKISDHYLSRANPVLKSSLGIYFPLASINSAALGVPLLLTLEQVNFFEAFFYGVGHAIGFTFILVIFSALRERLEAAEIPTAFRGTAILLVTAGMMSLAFLGFIGLVK